MSSDAGIGRQRLSFTDLALLRVHDALRSLGSPGLLCQTQVWCAGRLDEARLAAALAGLCRRYPVLLSRLARTPGSADACWQFAGGGSLPLRVHELSAAGEAAVLRLGESLLNTPLDLRREPPLSFHLLRRPGAGDVLLLHFAHVLMDGRAPELLLREIDQPSPGSAEEDADPLAQYLGGFSWRRRLRGVLAFLASLRCTRGRPMTIARPRLADWIPGPGRLAVRSLTAADTERLAARLRKLCGYESVAPAVLASAFRATSACTPRRYGPRARCRTSVPISLRPAAAVQPIFRNLVSTVTVSAAREELADRDRLTRALNARVRDGLRRGEDLGALQLLALDRRGAALRRAVRDPDFAWSTIAFSFHGRGVAGFDSLAGTPIDRLFTVGTCAFPPGIGLLVNHLGGRLHLALIYVPGAIPEPLAECFLDTVVADLLAPDPGPSPAAARAP
jgi:hypothetical protein